MKSIAENIQTVVNDIKGFEQLYARPQDSVTLIAASKTQTAERIIEAYKAGIRNFGENYLQEAINKRSALSQEDIIWHFIGPIQSRKARDIALHFDWVHSVDRLVVAEKLSRNRPVGKPPLKVFIQVNISNDPNKSGVSVKQTAELAQQIMSLPGLQLRGLMTLPRAEQELSKQRTVFRELRRLLKDLQTDLPQMDSLSMGMSQDLEAAVAEGATFVRVGTAIFGAREPNSSKTN